MISSFLKKVILTVAPDVSQCRRRKVMRGHLLTFMGGRLHLDLAKENYERSGLVGKPVDDGGRKHVKTRFGRSAID